MSTATKNKPTETKPDPPKANAAAASASAPPIAQSISANQQPESVAAPEKKRTRAGQSMEKRLAVAGINVLEIVDRLNVEKMPAFKDAVPLFEALRTLTAEVNKKLIGPAKARITAIETEMTAALETKNYSQLATLAKELERLQKKIKG